MAKRRRDRWRSGPTRVASILLYGALLVAMLVEQWGRTTNDTRTTLVERPAEFLASTFSLWTPEYSLGEIQNQAYGYLFPHGLFFYLGDLVRIPPWVTERLWAWLLLVLACEGARLLARAVGLGAWPAWIAGIGYGLSLRSVAQIGVRSSEVLPPTVLPWAVLPIILAIRADLSARRAAILSAVIFMLSGGVNGTATAAPIPFAVILIVWAIRRRALRWSFLGWWATVLVSTSLWWATSLLILNRYSPRFYDYVEDADATTGTSGFFAALRGASNWVYYLRLGSEPNWPAGWTLVFNPTLVTISGIVAAVGMVGLVLWRSEWRQPFVLSAALGLVLMTVAHMGIAHSPLAQSVRDILDGALALLRNVHKADPLLRLPLAIGIGVAVDRMLQARIVTPRAWAKPMLVAVCSLLVLSAAQPVFALNTRTPGWTEMPEHWRQTAEFLADQGNDSRAWVIPGEGFAIKNWGWTMEEPLMLVGTTAWATRSQVPLTGPETIVLLSRMENILDSGVGADDLGSLLARLGFSHVVVAHDQDPHLSDSIPTNYVSIALARSGGVKRVAWFGAADFGPLIEVYQVTSEVAAEVSVAPVDDAVTVAGGPDDVVDIVSTGMVDRDAPVILQGDDGWNAPAQIVSDAYRLRERNFGRVHEALGTVVSPDEPRRTNRRHMDYPRQAGSQPLVARYAGIRYVDASTSQGFANVFGPTRPEFAPFAAVDGEPMTEWRSAAYLDAQVGQWLEIRFDDRVPLGRIRIVSPQMQTPVQEVKTWRVTAGGRQADVNVDVATNTATVDLGGIRADRVRFTAVDLLHKDDDRPIAIAEVKIDGVNVDRTLVVPYRNIEDDARYLFTARPEVRACVPTLFEPDCDETRRHMSDELDGIDRTIQAPRTGEWQVTGSVLPRANGATMDLLQPDDALLRFHASSTWHDDPTVGVRMAHDGSPTTSWIASPFDPDPTLYVDWIKPVTFDRIVVGGPPPSAIRPVTAVIRAGDEVRRVALADYGFFEPITASHVEITFENPHRGGLPIGLSEVALPDAEVAVPFEGADLIAVGCDDGPVVRVNGRTYRTKVAGFAGDIISAGRFELTSCDGPVLLEKGENRVSIASTDQFQVVDVTLTPVGAKAPTTHSASRSLTAGPATATRQEYEVGTGGAALLRTTRNFNPGWRATLNGAELPVQRIDGWAQGWRIPAGEGGRVVIDFAPQSLYLTLLIAGLTLAAVLLLLGVVLLLRSLPWQITPADPEQVRRLHARRVRVVPIILLGLGGWLVAGLVGAAGVLAAAILAKYPGPAAMLGGALIIVGTVGAAAPLLAGPSFVPPVADLLVGLGAALLLGLAAWTVPQADDP